MIRHHDGTEDMAAKISAQSKRGKIRAVVWTGGHRIVFEQQQADRAQESWKNWKIRQGWQVGNRVGGALRAYKDGVTEACLVHVYDARSRERER